jgi:hypothetical protein
VAGLLSIEIGACACHYQEGDREPEQPSGMSYLNVIVAQSVTIPARLPPRPIQHAKFIIDL